MLPWILYPLLGWALCVLLLVWSFRAEFKAAWREPVLKFPVLVIESDDWGPGTAQHAEALQRLRQVLLRYRDSRGRPALMALGVILALPDTAAIRAARMERYQRLPLTDVRFEPIRRALAQGIADGVFAVQLHGLEHYWPAALMNAAHTDPAVAQWLSADILPETEALPSHLQSRWTDASQLPSVALRDVDISQAVAEETALFKAVFDSPPLVVVPPTFVWSAAVEQAWAARGVRVVVTPGRRYEGRGTDGRPDRAGRDLRNGERSPAGVLYLTRDAYFEPALGHKAERLTAALARNTALGRPTLVESHRFNFVRAGATEALAELGRALDLALAAYPATRFLAPAELAEAMTQRAADLIEAGFRTRLRIWLVRLSILPRFWKLARISGLALPLRLVGRLVSETARPLQPRIVPMNRAVSPSSDPSGHLPPQAGEGEPVWPSATSSWVAGMTPRFSVIIAVYNGASTLARAIDSVLAQSHPVHELIVVDDGSDDDTARVAAHYGEQLRYLYQPNAGVSAARNAGVRLATGDWLAFLDADDIYYPDRIKWHAEWISEDPALDFLTGEQEYREPDGRLVKTSLVYTAAGRMLLARAAGAERLVMEPAAEIEAFVADHFGDTPTLSVPRQTFLELGGYPPGRAVCEDVSFLIRLTAISRRIGVVLRPLAIYYIYPGSATRRDPLRAQRLTVEAFTALKPQLAAALPAVQRGLRASLRSARYNLALALLREGRWIEALAAVLPSLLTQPGLSTLRDVLSVARGLDDKK